MIKIYFENGKLNKKDVYYLAHKNCGTYVSINAKDGYSNNLRKIILLKYDKTVYYVYTNSIALLNTGFCWDYKNDKCECYFRKNKKWTNIQDLTKKEISVCNNIEKMYRNSEFDL